MLKLIRRILAVIFWLGITWLFVDLSGMAHHHIAWMAKLQFLPSVLALNWLSIAIVLVLTFLLGRIYCSIICPLGVLQDFFAWIGKWKIFRKNKKAKFANRYSYSKPKTWLRLSVLALFLIMLLTGFSAGVVLLAPYSSYGRIVSSLLQVVYTDINNLLAQWSEANDNYIFSYVEPHNNPLILVVIASVTALILFVLAFMHGRTYCNTICPVGTVLGYMAKFSWLKMQVEEDKCIKCGLCEKNCKAACIKVEKGKPVVFDYTRCVTCGDCQTVCGKGALHLAPVGKKRLSGSKGTDAEEGKDGEVSRRSFLAITGATVAAAALQAQEKTTDGGLAVIEDKKLPTRKTRVTPPGSLSVQNLHDHCTACQLCIANCPNGVLRPSTDLDHFMQPEMQFDKSFCRPECTRCSHVCPTGAICSIIPPEKTAIQIGHAVWVKENCLPVAEGQRCGSCASHCPAEAIQMVPLDKSLKQNPDDQQWYDADGNRMDWRDLLMVPAVNTEKCIGCGKCEYLCPARPLAAIYVEGNEVHREI
ncbi:MAG: 4Fe-4S dicluster domain-containing protein [Bacteroidaceae bacterium]|nr:4Fe-4S dicluster domain-containing protein [Bacteroidaceae bacterium]